MTPEAILSAMLDNDPFSQWLGVSCTHIAPGTCTLEATVRPEMTNGFGGMLSFHVRGGADDAMALAARLQLFTRATSLGGIESLIEHRASIEGPTSTTPQNLLRVSIGIEHVDDLIDDLRQAIHG